MLYWSYFFLAYCLVFARGQIQTSCIAPGTWAYTLDDGPSIPITPRILDILRQRNIKVTFFVVGNMMQNPEQQALVKRAFDEGHLISAHTMTHRSLPTLADWEIHNEIEGVDNILHSVIGVTPTFLRPPYGDVDDRVSAVASQFGKTVVTWNVDSDDWRRPGDDEAVLDSFRQALAIPDLNQVISLSHDIQEVTLNIIERTLDLILSHGFKLVRLDECLQQPGYQST